MHYTHAVVSLMQHNRQCDPVTVRCFKHHQGVGNARFLNPSSRVLRLIVKVLCACSLLRPSSMARKTRTHTSTLEVFPRPYV